MPQQNDNSVGLKNPIKAFSLKHLRCMTNYGQQQRQLIRWGPLSKKAAKSSSNPPIWIQYAWSMANTSTKLVTTFFSIFLKIGRNTNLSHWEFWLTAPICADQVRWKMGSKNQTSRLPWQARYHQMAVLNLIWGTWTPKKIDISHWQNKEEDGILYMPRAGKILYKTKS